MGQDDARWSTITVMTTPRPSYLDGYLVVDSMGSDPVGVVRKERYVCRLFRFGVAPGGQPRDVFASREDAAVRLLEIAGGDPG